MSSKRYFTLIWVLICSACVEPFSPPNENNSGRTLVIESFINPAEGTGEVMLSRSIPLSSNEAAQLETGASVIIEDDNGSILVVKETQPGIYKMFSTSLSFEKKYRLHISTSDKRSYQSEFIEVKRTPAIDSITYAFVGDGVEIRVNTHDPTGNSKYYRWNYIETYEYSSPFRSLFRFESVGVVVNRPAAEFIQHCWNTQSSTSILLESTVRLQADKVSNFPLLLITPESVKFSKKYSILVRQQALTEQAFNYWTALQKTTENLGGLFDPLPAEVKGNIVCVSHPGEKVIGFFRGSSVEEKRIFIVPEDLPEEATQYPGMFCDIDSIMTPQIPQTPFTTLFIDAIRDTREQIIGYTTSDSRCIDCRTFSGTLTKPDFWE